MKSATLVTIIGALIPVVVTSPCKPSTNTSVTNIQSTTTSPDITITEGTSTVGSATTEVTTIVTETSVTEASETSTTLETSTAESTITTAAASTTTSAAPVSKCGLEGVSITAPSENAELTTFQGCRDLCLADETCQAFLPNYNGKCYLYTAEVSQFVAASENTGAFFYNRDCVSE
ncbi:hypothetical protein FGRMN_9007 [Fusarium graminum]|nr:hypothetical protein FGRMN_9007 [Fusarium graminum]